MPAQRPAPRRRVRALPARPHRAAARRDARRATRRRSRARSPHAAADRAEELDELIDRHAHGWTLERIAPLERSDPARRAARDAAPRRGPGGRADPAGGRDRRGRRDREDVLRRGGAGLRQRHPRAQSCARCARMRRIRMSSIERLDDLIARLERAAEQLRSRRALAATPPRRSSRTAPRSPTQAAAELEQLRARGGAREPRARPGQPAVGRAAPPRAAVSASYPDAPARGGRGLPRASCASPTSR